MCENEPALAQVPAGKSLNEDGTWGGTPGASEGDPIGGFELGAPKSTALPARSLP